MCNISFHFIVTNFNACFYKLHIGPKTLLLIIIIIIIIIIISTLLLPYTNHVHRIEQCNKDNNTALTYNNNNYGNI